MLVTTFYSFKGGVGRTLLLANVGALLAKRGRVLLWDLDLEAPGMHRIPALTPARVADGFLEWVAAWEEAGRPLPLPHPLRRRLAGCVCATPAHPNLFLLPAFADGADFPRLHNAIDWPAFLVHDPELGIGLFREVVAVLREATGIEHLLVDARTGITDLGGLLAAVIPDATVLVGNLAWQNTYGLLQIKQALEPATEGRLPTRGDAPPLELLLVASPVPADPVRREARRATWDALFKARPFAEVPFDERLLFEESLQALTEEHAPAVEAYRRVADRLEGIRRDKESRSVGAGPDPRVQEDTPPRRPERRFVDRVARLLRLSDYAVEQADGADGGVDLVATRAGLFLKEHLAVECKDSRAAVGRGAIEYLRTHLSPGTTGMIVARAFTAAARASAAEAPPVHVVTIDELERQLFDPSAYLAKLRTSFEASALARTYVPQRAQLEASPKTPIELLPHAHAWAGGAGNPLWVLLGDYGTGKTAFFRRFAYELAIRAQEDPSAPFPIAVDLKRFPNAISLEGLLQEHLRSEIGWHGNPALVLELLSAGRAVLLLDAFDEMGVAAVGRGVDEQLRHLLAPAAEAPWEQGGNRVLLTCRTHLFRDERQVHDATQAEDDARASGDSALGEVARGYRATIDELALLDDEQVGAFLVNHLGSTRAVEARAFIRETYGLASLAPRPVLLEMIIASLPRLVESGGEVTVSKLYEAYTGDWLRAQSRSLATTSEQRARVLRLLARELWGRPERRIHHRDLLAALRAMPPALFAGLDLDRVDLELRTAAFLTRTSDGHYGFSHKSFLEFFLAKHVALSVADGSLADALDTERLSPEVNDFVIEMAREEGVDLAAAVGDLLRAPYRARTSENALRLGLAAEHAGWGRVIPERAQLAGARLADEDLHGADLAGADLRGALLTRADLRDARLLSANLGGVSAADATFARSSLRGALLRGALLLRADLRSTSLADADLAEVVAHGATFRDADLAKASFAGASARAARFAGARAAGVDWEGAHPTAATAVGCVPPPPGVRPPPARPRWWFESGATALVADALPGQAARDGRAAEPLDSFRVAVGSTDGTVRVFDLVAARLERVLPMPGRVAPRWVAWSPKGDALLVAVGAELRCYPTTISHPRWVARLGEDAHGVWLPDGERILAGGAEGTAILDAASGQRTVLDAEPSRWVDVSPSGKMRLTIGATVRLLSDAGTEEIPVQGPARCGAFLDDDRVVVVAPHEIRVFDLTGRELLRHAGLLLDPVVRRGEGGVAVLSLFGNVWVDPSLHVSPLDGQRAAVHSSPTSGISFREAYVASSRWLPGGGRTVPVFGRSLLPRPVSPVGSLAVREGTVVVALRNARVYGWEPLTGGVRQLESPGALLVAWMPDGRLATHTPGEPLYTWRSLDGTPTEHLVEPIVPLCFDRGSRVLVAGEGERIEWLDLASGERTPGPEGAILAAAPDGRRLAFRTPAGSCLADPDGTNEVLVSSGVHDAVSFSPSGRLAVLARLDAVLLLDARSGAQLASFARASAAAVSPDDELFVRVEGAALYVHRVGAPEAAPSVWEIEVPGRAIAFVDARYAVVLHADEVLRLWSVHTGRRVREHLWTMSGWVTVEADGRHRGERSGLRALVYYDPEEESETPTTWLAEDLPELRRDD